MDSLYTNNEMLALADLLRGEAMGRMIDSLGIPTGGVGLDAGCGIGSLTPMLVNAASRGGYVVGIDYDIDALRCARTGPVRNNLSHIKGTLTRLPFPDSVFDWALSVDCAGMMPGSAHDMIAELVRILKPGGMLALAAWTSQMLLPGHPILEAHLSATPQGVAPFTDGLSPSLHFLRLRERLEAAGLNEVRVRSFLGEIHPPRDENEERALASLFFMRWGDDLHEFPEAERLLYRSLIDPASDDCIFHRSDYYAWFTYTLFTGRPGRGREPR